MPCYHPKKAFFLYEVDKNGEKHFEKTKNNKIKRKITDFSVDHLEMYKNGTWHSVYDSFVSQNALLTSNDWQSVPCGKCIGCRLDQANEWAGRCMLEAQSHKSNYFLTITYDELNVPTTEYVDEKTGEICSAYTLQKKDWQDFMKRLRKAVDEKGLPKLRFYMCGEYGDKTLRPHYHAIVFGLELDDLIFYRVDRRGNKLYNSPFLDKIWGKGFITIGQVTYESAGYTARYVMKKCDGDNSLFEACNMEPEFTLMSRRQGIAREYFETHNMCIDDDYIYISTDSGGKKFKLPRYARKLAEAVNLVSVLKRQVSTPDDMVESNITGIEKQTSLDYLSELKVAEDNKKRQVKSLVRSI